MKVFHNFDLTNYNSYRIKSICKTAYFPETIKESKELLSSINNYYILGGGNNTILSKSYYDSNFIIFNNNMSNYELKNNVLIAECGMNMENLSIIALENSLSGIEMFYDIPSSLGGAVVMNAGANGEEIKDIIQKVEYLDLTDNKIKTINKIDINFEYRNSLFQKSKNKIILKVWLELIVKEQKEIFNKMQSLKNKRLEKQPRDYPNCGSVFKRPEGKFVGTMIEDAGLKGFSIGGAMISPKHAGFIVNTGSATGDDILNLIDHIKNVISKKYEIDLIVEQRII